jgi:hypothetical protein
VISCPYSNALFWTLPRRLLLRTKRIKTGSSLSTAQRLRHARDTEERFRNYQVAHAQKDYNRMATIGADILNNPLQEPQARVIPRPVTDDEHTVTSVRNCLRVLTTSGRLGKAKRTLVSSKLFAITSQTAPTIHKLFIPRKEPLKVPLDVQTNSLYDFTVDKEIVLDVMTHKDRTTGRGLSNVGYVELQA